MNLSAEEPRVLSLADGTSIAFRHSPGTEPGVLFCAGFNSNMQGDKALALEAWCVEQGRQFTRFDYFGHGESDGALEEGSIGRWRDDTIAVLDEVTSGPQIIVGSSMGGWIMLLTALARPERVHSLVGIAAAPDFTERMRDSRLGAQQLQDLAATGYCELPNSYDEGEPYRIGLQLLNEGRNHLLLHSEISIDAPVRLLHGQCDEDVPWETALAIAERLSSDDVEIQLVKAGDHRLSRPEDLRRLRNAIAGLLGSP